MTDHILVIKSYCLVLGAVDDELILHTLSDLKQGKAVKIPEYDFVTHSRYVCRQTTVTPL